MNKKISSLLILLILLLSTIVVYTVLNQPTIDDTYPSDSFESINEDTMTSEINSIFLDETRGIEIGEMI